MNLLWGWLVVLCAMGLVVGAAWYVGGFDALVTTDDEPEPPDDDDAAIEATQVIRLEPLILDTREPEPVEAEVIAGELVDELGAWRPWEYEMEQPLILGDVLMSGNWGGLRATELGMIAA
jgi:hypothetical protein